MNKIPQTHRETVKDALIASTSLGPLGALFSAVDIAAIAGIWGILLASVASWEGVSMDTDSATKICKSALLGMGGYYVGCKTATKIFLMIPGAGIFMAMGISSVTNILFTYRFALTICSMFSKKNVNNLELGELAENIKSMYAGNGIASDVRDIVSIYME